MTRSCGCSTCSGRSSSSSYGSYGSYGYQTQQQQQQQQVVPYSSAVASRSCQCVRCVPVAPPVVQNPCVLNCSTAVRAETQYSPSVSVTNVCKQDTSFEVAVDICAKPRCYISQQPTITSCDPCNHTCRFKVNLCCPFEPKARIYNCGPNPTASFDLNVDVATQSQCVPSRC